MIKYGLRNVRQLYKCKFCNRRFVGGNRLSVNDIISDYVEHKLTLKELLVKYRKSVSTIQRRLRQMRHVHMISRYKDVVIQMDTTYWDRNYGLMVIKDALRDKWYNYRLWQTMCRTWSGLSSTVSPSMA